MRVRRSLPGAAQLGVGLAAQRDDTGAALGTALAALAAGYFTEGEAIVRFERMPATVGKYPIEHEEGVRRAIALGDMVGAARHLHALTGALTLPARSPESARARFRDLIVVISRAFAARAGPCRASLAWADRWGAAVYRASPRPPEAAARLQWRGRSRLPSSRAARRRGLPRTGVRPRAPRRAARRRRRGRAAAASTPTIFRTCSGGSSGRRSAATSAAAGSSGRSGSLSSSAVPVAAVAAASGSATRATSAGPSGARRAEPTRVPATRIAA